MQSRRQFLGSTALAASAAALPSLLRGQSSGEATPLAAGAASAGTPTVLVDWHSHYTSKVQLRLLRDRKTAPRVFDRDGKTYFENATTVSSAAGPAAEAVVSDIPSRIAHLDKNGIKKQLLTQGVAAGFDATLPLEELRPFYRAYNDELAEVVRAHPDKFFGVAAVPAADPVWAAEELVRAHRDLGFIGVSLPLNAFTSLEGARFLAPLFAAGNKHRSHFFIHRGPASNVVPGQPPLILPSDTDYARWSVVSGVHLASGGITLGLTDFLDPYPDVSVQVIMLAGFLPHLWESIVPAAQRAGLADPLARLRRVYFDPGPYSRNGPWTVEAINTIGADRVLFGTDYFAATHDVGLSIATLNVALTAEQRHRLYVQNTRDLLASKGITI